jgi:hypothetical protein
VLSYSVPVEEVITSGFDGWGMVVTVPPTIAYSVHSSPVQKPLVLEK